MTFDQLQAKLYRKLKPADWSQTKHGGWVEKTAYVAPTARVLDDAVISGNARVYGDAQVYDGAQVSGIAWIYGNAQVYGDARVSGNALVYGRAQVYGDARVYGNAWVHGNAQVSSRAQVFGDAQVDEGKLDFGTWSSGDAWDQYQARQNLAAELQADLEESARRLVS